MLGGDPKTTGLPTGPPCPPSRRCPLPTRHGQTAASRPFPTGHQPGSTDAIPPWAEAALRQAAYYAVERGTRYFYVVEIILCRRDNRPPIYEPTGDDPYPSDSPSPWPLSPYSPRPTTLNTVSLYSRYMFLKHSATTCSIHTNGWRSNMHVSLRMR